MSGGNARRNMEPFALPTLITSACAPLRRGTRRSLQRALRSSLSLCLWLFLESDGLGDRLELGFDHRREQGGDDRGDAAEAGEVTVEAQQRPGDAAAGQPLVRFEQVAQQLLLRLRR